MNSFGKHFIVQIYGESHGLAVGCVINGCPPGLTIDAADFDVPLMRRRGGGAGSTPRVEADTPIFISGVFNGFTTGAPINIQFQNQQTQPKDYDAFLKQPRPGHADFVAFKKFNGFQDYRGSGHFSGRLTVALVAAGVIADKILKKHIPSFSCNASVMEVGGNADVDKGIQEAIDGGDSAGAIVECKVNGLSVGLGEPFFDSCESVISHLVFSIPAIKAIEFGSGFAAAKMRGSEHNDAQMDASGATSTNNSGGIVGGISNGNEIVFRVAVKPASSTPKVQVTYHNETKKMETLEVKGRHDLVIALRVPPVLEAVTMIGLIDLYMSSLANGTSVVSAD